MFMYTVAWLHISALILSSDRMGKKCSQKYDTNAAWLAIPKKINIVSVRVCVCRDSCIKAKSLPLE